MINKINGKPQVNKIIGMDEKDARSHLKSIDMEMRVTNRDGKALMVKGMEVNMNRVNVFVNKGVVSNIDKIG